MEGFRLRTITSAGILAVIVGSTIIGAPVTVERLTVGTMSALFLAVVVITGDPVQL
ncbi:hypothetical protein [Halocatena halophila]|uniref:hypothetical protein n=1 Tax=Halocatena halophila TaxID=2814576 RepID=UPI002ED21B82